MRAQLEVEQENTHIETAAHLSEAGYETAANKVLDMPVCLVDETAIRMDGYAPKARGTASRVSWKCEVEDASLVPREYLVPDMKLIAAHVRVKKGDTAIPGVRVWSEASVTARSGG